MKEREDWEKHHTHRAAIMDARISGRKRLKKRERQNIKQEKMFTEMEQTCKKKKKKTQIQYRNWSNENYIPGAVDKKVRKLYHPKKRSCRKWRNEEKKTKTSWTFE